MPRDNSKAQLWATRLDRFRRSGLSISQFCRNEDITIQSFNYWRKRTQSDSSRSALPIPSSHFLEPNNGLVRFTIEARGVKIECQSDSLQAIDSVLAWATRHQDTGFQQLIVRD